MQCRPTTINAFLRTQLDDLKAKGLYKAERRIESPQRSGITVNGREVVNFCANNYLGLANHPDIVAAAHDGLKAWGYGLSSRCGSSAARRTCTSSSKQQIADVLRQGRQHPLHLLLRRQRRAVRAAARRAGRDPLRRTEPRQHHRRRAALQGAAVPLQAQRHGRPEGQAGGGEGLPLQADLHRQRLQHGRRPGEAAGHLRPGRPVRRRWSGSTTATRTGHLGATGRGAAEELGVLDRIDIITSTLGKTLGGAERRVHGGAAPRSWTGCGTGRGRTCSRTRCRRRSWSRR